MAFSREEVDAIWYTSTFLKTFVGEVSGAGGQEEGGEEEGEGKERCQGDGGANKILIEFLESHPLSEEEQRES